MLHSDSPIQNKRFWRYFGIFIVLLAYLLLSHQLGRALFTTHVRGEDGFFDQISFVQEGIDLGAVGMLHRIRYFIVLPFLWMDARWLDPALFFCYVGGVMLVSKRWQVCLIVALCLLFSLGFSYRTVLCMLSIALLKQHILYKLQTTNYKLQTIEPIKALDLQYKEALLLLYGLLLSLLSTGVFIAYLLILINYRQLMVSSRWAKWLLNTLLLLATTAILGAIGHKILFFSNPAAFDDAVAVNAGAFAALNMASFGAIVSNLLERSLLFENLSSGISPRFYVIVLFGFLVVVMLCLRRDRLSTLLTVLFLCALLMEGLMLYSLLVSILLLITQEALPLLNNR